MGLGGRPQPTSQLGALLQLSSSGYNSDCHLGCQLDSDLDCALPSWSVVPGPRAKKATRPPSLSLPSLLSQAQAVPLDDMGNLR